MAYISYISPSALALLFSFAQIANASQRLDQMLGTWNSDQNGDNIRVEKDKFGEYNIISTANGEGRISNITSYGAHLAMEYKDLSCFYYATFTNDEKRLNLQLRGPSSPKCLAGVFNKSDPNSPPAPPSPNSAAADPEVQQELFRFRLCNKTHYKINVAITDYFPEFQQWISRGWWKVDSFSCKLLENLGNTQGQAFYYYAESVEDGNLTWGGKHGFCVHSSKFRYPYRKSPCNENERLVGFKKLIQEKPQTTETLVCRDCPEY